jgi:hypothetical protein
MSRLRSLGKNCEGTAAIEMALVAPVFLLIIFGMIVYGSWFSLAQSVQSLATESARASIGGLDPAERQSLALAYIDAQTSPSGLDRNDIDPVIDVSASVTRVSIRLDITGHPVMALCQFIPSPPRVIERSAVIMSGRASRP